MNDRLSRHGRWPDGIGSYTTRNSDFSHSAQARYLGVELIPGKLRKSSHQGFEFAFRGTLERFKNSGGNRVLQSHHDSSLFGELPSWTESDCLIDNAQGDFGVGAAESERSVACGR